MKKTTYKAEVCECCHQTTTYALAIDRGTTEIVKAVAKAVGEKGINCVHIRNELEGKTLRSTQVANTSRPRLHGLIARVEGEPGNYLLTRKGADFLRGEYVNRVAIIQKGNQETDKHTIGYQEDDQCCVHDFTSDTDRWEGINYTIQAGRVIQDPTRQEQRYRQENKIPENMNSLFTD